jgi:hypothetical protein
MTRTFPRVAKVALMCKAESYRPTASGGNNFLRSISMNRYCGRSALLGQETALIDGTT